MPWIIRPGEQHTNLAPPPPPHPPKKKKHKQKKGWKETYIQRSEIPSMGNRGQDKPHDYENPCLQTQSENYHQNDICQRRMNIFRTLFIWKCNIITHNKRSTHMKWLLEYYIHLPNNSSSKIYINFVLSVSCKQHLSKNYLSYAEQNWNNSVTNHIFQISKQ